jgi:antitoxin component YwqK of YwqJK toxin-antitoxin module
MNTLIFFMAFLLQGREKLVEYKDIVSINNIVYTKKNARTPFTGAIIERDRGNGALISKATYKNGMLTGPYIKWWEKDKIKSIKNFVNGIEEGEYLEYFENGKIDTRGQYKDGNESGTWYFYDEDGKISSLGQYKDGDKSGTWYFYDKDGKVIETKEYP